MSADTRTQAFLQDITDAALFGDSLEAVRAAHDLPPDEQQEWVDLIVQLNSTLVKVEPDPQFAQRLKGELLGKPQTGVLWRIRKLPARVQIAATAAIVGGFALLLRRLFLGEDSVSRETSSVIHDESPMH